MGTKNGFAFACLRTHNQQTSTTSSSEQRHRAALVWPKTPWKTISKGPVMHSSRLHWATILPDSTSFCPATLWLTRCNISFLLWLQRRLRFTYHSWFQYFGSITLPPNLITTVKSITYSQWKRLYISSFIEFFLSESNKNASPTYFRIHQSTFI
jgi:hypothetical protein